MKIGETTEWRIKRHTEVEPRQFMLKLQLVRNDSMYVDIFIHGEYEDMKFLSDNCSKIEHFDSLSGSWLLYSGTKILQEIKANGYEFVPNWRNAFGPQKPRKAAFRRMLEL